MITSTRSYVETARLADQLERAFRGGAWHGPALGQALADVDAATASRRPLPGAHTIWEIALHARTWIDVARRRLAGEAVGELAPELDWSAEADGSGDAWRAALAGLEEAHCGLHSTVLALEDERLEDPVAGSDPTVRGLLLGVLQHNVYHAGQISILKRAGDADGESS
jgi:uncharacterized damage-inducible protein DinB